MKAALNRIGALAAIVSALLWLYSALIEVPDNIDAVVGALQRIATSNGYAAMAAFVSALCFGLAGACQRLEVGVARRSYRSRCRWC